MRSLGVVAGLCVYYSSDWFSLQLAWQSVFAASLQAIGHHVDSLGRDVAPFLLVDDKTFVLSRNCTYLDVALVLTPLLWQPRDATRTNLIRLLTIGVGLALFNWLRVVCAIHVHVVSGVSWRSVHFWPDLLFHVTVITAASIHALRIDWEESTGRRTAPRRRNTAAVARTRTNDLTVFEPAD